MSCRQSFINWGYDQLHQSTQRDCSSRHFDVVSRNCSKKTMKIWHLYWSTSWPHFHLLLSKKAGNKASFYNVLPAVDTSINVKDINVIDDGFLLHRMKWQAGSTFSSICQQHISYVKSHRGLVSTVIFNGHKKSKVSFVKLFEQVALLREIAALTWSISNSWNNGKCRGNIFIALYYAPSDQKNLNQHRNFLFKVHKPASLPFEEGSR